MKSRARYSWTAILALAGMRLAGFAGVSTGQGMPTLVERAPRNTGAAHSLVYRDVTTLTGPATRGTTSTSSPRTTGAAPVNSWEYLTMPDGAQLRYTVVLPAPVGRFPVAMLYNGYDAGTNPFVQLGQRLLDAGFALFSVQVRGTGCSSGAFHLFAPSWASDGARAVEWAARQSWSTGRVGMYGVSFSAFMQMYTEAGHPPHLAAIMPAGLTGSFFRDAVYPGGIFQSGFPSVFGAIVLARNQSSEETARQQGDGACATNASQHPPASGLDLLAGQFARHPYLDRYWTRTITPPREAFRRDAVPTLIENAWQDEIVGGSWADAYMLLPRDRTWFIVTNGSHNESALSSRYADQALRFFEHFVAGRRNGWDATPRVQIWHETNATTGNPAWVTSYRSWPPPVARQIFFLRSGHRLSATRPASTEPSDTYDYPRSNGGSLPPDYSTWTPTVYSAEGGIAYTTAPLQRDLTLFGPSSLDLWLRSTAADADVQATISEVRPDGQEQYLQRGFLRASARQLDAQHSTATRPWPTYQSRDAHPLQPGKATLLRIPLQWLEHTVRAGSRLRITIEAPTASTGDWSFAYRRTEAVNTILHDMLDPSRWVFGVLPGERAEAPLPACGSVSHEPCRPGQSAPSGIARRGAASSGSTPRELRHSQPEWRTPMMLHADPMWA